ncbi:4439_t:CDS:2, partial [Gigaspora margarita]
MLTDLCMKSNNAESPSVTLIRRIFIVVFITLILTCFMLLIVNVQGDLPSLKSTQVRNDNIPAPRISASSCSQSIIQPTYNAVYKTYNGSFASDIKMDGNSVIRFDFYFTSTEDSIGNITQPIIMSIMDPGYGPNIVQYHSNIFPYNETFVQSIEFKNIHYLSQNSNYMVRFSKTIRDMAAPNDFRSLIGIKPHYYSIPYIESNIEYIIYKNLTNGANWYASVSITPVTTIVEKETEQRDKTVISLLGSISGIYAAITGFYIFLFGPGTFSPWGYVQKTIISKEGLIYTADTLAELGKLGLEERVRRLEALDMFLNEHVIGIPFDRNSKAHELDLKHGKKCKVWCGK